MTTRTACNLGQESLENWRDRHVDLPFLHYRRDLNHSNYLYCDAATFTELCGRAERRPAHTLVVGFVGKRLLGPDQPKEPFRSRSLTPTPRGTGSTHWAHSAKVRVKAMFCGQGVAGRGWTAASVSRFGAGKHNLALRAGRAALGCPAAARPLCAEARSISDCSIMARTGWARLRLERNDNCRIRPAGICCSSKHLRHRSQPLASPTRRSDHIWTVSNASYFGASRGRGHRRGCRSSSNPSQGAATGPRAETFWAFQACFLPAGDTPPHPEVGWIASIVIYSRAGRLDSCLPSGAHRHGGKWRERLVARNSFATSFTFCLPESCVWLTVLLFSSYSYSIPARPSS